MAVKCLGAFADPNLQQAVLNRKMSKKTTRKYAERQKAAGDMEKMLLDQFQTGRVLASISSRPGQCGRSDGYILEVRRAGHHASCI
jgi:hypothetical protein